MANPTDAEALAYMAGVSDGWGAVRDKLVSVALGIEDAATRGRLLEVASAVRDDIRRLTAADKLR